MIPSNRLPVCLWQNDVLHSSGDVNDVYESQLKTLGLFEKALAYDGRRQTHGGASERETYEHFFTRYLNSVSRVQYVMLDPLKSFEDIPRALFLTLSSHRISVLDIPCGAGAGIISLLATLKELRAAGLLPILPLSVTILGADFSPSALNLCQGQLTAFVHVLASAGISIKVVTREWNALHVQQTNQLIDKYLEGSLKHSEYLVLVANFSGASKSLFTKFEDSFKQLWIRLSGEVSRFSTILWIEPNATDGIKLFTKLVELVSSYIWFLPISNSPTTTHRCTYNFYSRLQAKVIPSGVMVRSYRRTTSDTTISSNGRLLHIRSLNQLSRDHQFTYIGARVLAESIHPDVIDTWSSEYIARKGLTARRQVYWKYSIFKGFDSDGQVEYRKCVIGSPTTNLTEAWLLNRLSQEEVFAQHPSVYSYYWSDAASSHLFRYYFKGYMEREHDIAKAASAMSDSCVIVLDLKRFYPSVNVASVRHRFARRVERSGMNSFEKDAAIRCVEELTSIKNEVGLPIGPPLSHMLANVFLEEFDNILTNNFPGCYFRYVDDVALVVPRHHRESAQRFFEEVADKEGLKVNFDKVDIMTGPEWTARVGRRPKAGEDSFGQLLSDVRRYLAHNTDDFDRVRTMFKSEGFALPFSRLQSVASSSKSFRQFLEGVWSRSGGLFGRSIPRPPILLERAKRLRRSYEKHLLESVVQPLPASGMHRRWAIQDIRYHLNRSLYLHPTGRRHEILEMIPDCLELRPTRTVLEALVSGDATEMTKYPGPTVFGRSQGGKRRG
jgi:hypothetical protein